MVTGIVDQRLVSLDVGVASTVILGTLLGGEPRRAARIFGIRPIVAGIVGP